MPEPIEVTFLGTGSSIPSVKRNHPAILLHMGPDWMLFDCGEGTQLQLEKAGVSPMKIKRIFISHWHADHFSGVLPLIETLHLYDRKEPLEVYGPEASRFVDALIELSYWGIGFPIKTIDCGEKDVEKILETDKYEIYAVKVEHSIPAVGYCFKEKDHWSINMKLAKKYGLKGKQLSDIKEKGSIALKNITVKINDIAKIRKGRKVVYSGDTKVCKRLFKMSKDADLLIHDGTFVEEVPYKYHASVQSVAKYSKKYNVKKLILTHLSRRYRTSKEILVVAKKYFKQVKVAEDLMKVRL